MGLGVTLGGYLFWGMTEYVLWGRACMGGYLFEGVRGYPFGDI